MLESPGLEGWSTCPALFTAQEALQNPCIFCPSSPLPHRFRDLECSSQCDNDLSLLWLLPPLGTGGHENRSGLCPGPYPQGWDRALPIASAHSWVLAGTKSDVPDAEKKILDNSYPCQEEQTYFFLPSSDKVSMDLTLRPLQVSIHNDHEQLHCIEDVN